MPNPLRSEEVAISIRAVVSNHLGGPWTADQFLDLTDRGSHPCGIFSSPSLSVFAKLSSDPHGMELFDAELKGLALLRAAGAQTPFPLGAGVFRIDDRAVVLFEALTERAGTERTTQDFQRMGHALGHLHLVTSSEFGLRAFDGFFGPLTQDNRPAGTTWAEFYAERRLLPRLREAVDSGDLPHSLAHGVDALVARLPALSGPDPRPTLLHGDAQQNNFVSTDAGAFLIDPAPYFGHPEADLALIDYFEPVPMAFFDGYRERGVIDTGFAERRELWRLHAYLAGVVAVGLGPFGLRMLDRIEHALRLYR